MSMTNVKILVGADSTSPRAVTGLGTGFETSTIPTWHAECAKAHSRGFAVFIEVSASTRGFSRRC